MQVPIIVDIRTLFAVEELFPVYTIIEKASESEPVELYFGGRDQAFESSLRFMTKFCLDHRAEFLEALKA